MKKNQYIYDNGFGKRVYICTNPKCKSHRLVAQTSGGFSPPYYICDDCMEISFAPSWEPVFEDESKEVYDPEDEFAAHHTLLAELFSSHIEN